MGGLAHSIWSAGPPDSLGALFARNNGRLTGVLEKVGKLAAAVVVDENRVAAPIVYGLVALTEEVPDLAVISEIDTDPTRPSGLYQSPRQCVVGLIDPVLLEDVFVHLDA